MRKIDLGVGYSLKLEFMFKGHILLRAGNVTWIMMRRLGQPIWAENIGNIPNISLMHNMFYVVVQCVCTCKIPFVLIKCRFAIDVLFPISYFTKPNFI